MNKKAKSFLRRIKRRYAKHDILLENIQKKLPELEKYLEKIIHSEGDYEGGIYRFYHYSFKVYYIHENTKEIVKLLQDMNPNRPKRLSSFFEEIFKDAENIGAFNISHNKEWTKHTRPIVEAFLHAKYFLEMAVICGREMKGLKTAPTSLYQRWAALLELYNIR